MLQRIDHIAKVISAFGVRGTTLAWSFAIVAAARGQRHRYEERQAKQEISFHLSIPDSEAF
jgi:hypothetical protein